MKAEYTPTMEQIEDGYAHDPESEYRDPVNYGSIVAANRRAFRRALVAHDREVAAKALTDHRAAIERWYEAHPGGLVPKLTVFADLTARAAALGVPEEAEHG